MRSPLTRVAENVIRDTVVERWALAIGEMRYFPEGGGAYHWIADDADADGVRWFVTCDDLDTKPWLGTDRDSVFARLQTAYGIADALRRNAGLEFVVAPVPASVGSPEPAVRVDERHSVSVFAYVEGQPGRWGEPFTPHARADVIGMLARLHQQDAAAIAVAAVAAGGGLARRGLDVPGRGGLEEALDSLGERWDGGPLGELARAEVAANARLAMRWLDQLDRFASNAADGDRRAVITHGEPHPGNLINTSAGPALVDWDTVALGRPERDLWMFAGGDRATADLVTTYANLTGVKLDADALAAYRLLWALADVASFINQLRGEHERVADTERALVALQLIFGQYEPAPYGPRPT